MNPVPRLLLWCMLHSGSHTEPESDNDGVLCSNRTHSSRQDRQQPVSVGSLARCFAIDLSDGSEAVREQGGNGGIGNVLQVFLQG